MTTEVLDIIDTAVKIGLGALISGVTTYYITNINHKKDTEKELQKRKLNIIEDAVTLINEHFSAFTSLISVIDGVRKSNPKRQKLDLTIDADKVSWDFLYEHDNIYCNSRKQEEFATSKLELIGLSDVTKTLDPLCDIDTKVRSMVIFNKEIPSDELLDIWRQSIRKVKKDFFQEISNNYKS